ncbi:MAG: hypothetical protein HGB28_03835 [Oscillochloris sp.]|nr:hypothetical protein [Oscillochloris sp.]
MKILTRTLILLVAAMVVVGITMALQSAGLLAVAGGGERRPSGDFAEGSRPPGFMPGGEGMRPEGFGGHREGFGDREGGHEGGRSGIFAAGELVRNLVITAVIIALVSLLSRAVRTLRPQRR